MKIYFLSLALIFFDLTEAKASTKDTRPRDINERSTFQILLSSELLRNRELRWEQSDGRFGKKCTLSIMSRFDQALAERTPNVEYELTFGGTQGQSVVSFDNGFIQDQFSLTLTTENKSLPLLNFDCFSRSPISKGVNKWTVSKVEEFIAQPGFFKNVIPAPETILTAFELIPSLKAMKALVPLRYATAQSGPNSIITVESPGIQNGKIVKTFEPGPRCSAHYAERNTVHLRPFDVVIPAGVELQSLYVIDTRIGPQMYFKDPNDQFELSISCNFKNTELKSFSQIEEQMNGIFEFRK